VVGHGDRNVLHSFTVTHFMWTMPGVVQPDLNDAQLETLVNDRMGSAPLTTAHPAPPNSLPWR